MANFMISRIKVKDFADWKASYDAHEPSRAAAGVSEKHLFQDVDDPNTVTILFEAENLKLAEEFSNSDDLVEAMQDAGVLGEPHIYFVKD